MKSSEVMVYGTICVGLFFTGVVWAPSFSNPDAVKNSIEVMSYIATILACTAAISALNSWRSQFKYSERYTALKSLLESTDELRSVRSYLNSLQYSYIERYSSGGIALDMLEDASEEKLEALEQIHKVFTQRFNFLTTLINQDEFSDFPGFKLVSPSYIYGLSLEFSGLYADLDKHHFIFKTKSLIQEQSLTINNTTAWLRGKIRYMT